MESGNPFSSPVSTSPPSEIGKSAGRSGFPISAAHRLRAGEAKSPLIYAVICLCLTTVFIADLYTPLGLAVWVFYLLPVVLTLFVWRIWAPPIVGLVVAIFMIVGFFLSPPGTSAEIARTNRGFGITTVIIMAAVGYFFIRNKLTVRRQNWLQAGQMELSEVLGGEQRVEELGENILRFLAEYVDAHAGAFFASRAGDFGRVATYGVPEHSGIPDRFSVGDGLLGQAVKDRRTFIVRDVPHAYLTVGSALARGKPNQLVIAPVAADDKINAVYELGFIHSLDEAVVELCERVSDSIGVAVRSAHYRAHLQDLLEETQRQGEELQAQSEELRVSNEELDEQSRALKESHGRLEQQQAELEQTNVQLEEQTQQLESQRDELARTTERLEVQAGELTRASRYKSDFLANMSHELRTPLNSSLILAKLLADNPQGNLTDEQVQFAETIRGAGNDLLALINDILDLSKIEAGRMEIHPEAVAIQHLVNDLLRMFEPVASSKGLALSVDISPNCPNVIDTDRQRLEQILKNLLSNAIKFTEAGSVTLRVSRVMEDRVAFAIGDTGIGIPKEYQQMVFEAFRQADGTTNRQFGGTGLGLSISRELVRLLGGDLQLVSEPGQGSTFTVTIPDVFEVALVRVENTAPTRSLPISYVERRTAAAAPSLPTIQLTEGTAPKTHKRVSDDRELLGGNDRVILVVEDDHSFARILADLAHELRFKCLIADTAEEGLALAVQYLPSAVLLDIGLPDHSGLTVLDRLKHDARSRHIPVHVVSANDDAEQALALGAVGYIIKPVEREKLVEALQRLETRLAQRMRRVLVVEDDAVQLDSIKRLLGSHDVETVGAGRAAECLDLLKAQTFDCMVLDLSLPDASGYSLLETLSREDAYSFPPVIVYTGRELSPEDEQRLRRYSKSIIIKGAKSPERLLDEVTLFLHQVVADLPPEQQKMLEKARSRNAALENRRVLVVEDDVRNLFAVTRILEPRGVTVQIARNGREAIQAVESSAADPARKIDLVLMDVMMPEMDGLTATRELRHRPEWRKLPIIMLTAKAMRNDQEECIAAGANDYLAKPLDVEKLLSLVRVWMPR